MTRFASLARPLGLFAGMLLVGCATHPAAQADPDPPTSARSVAFACEDGSKLTVVFNGGMAAANDAHGRVLHLAQQESGSGILYAGEGYALRGKGEEIDWTAADGSTLACSAGTSPLIGSHWELVEYRTADGRSEHPADPTHYGLELIAGGRLAMQLDCNRATGRWQAHSTGPGGGVITLDAPAMTRAMCPGDSWDTRLARDLASAKTYTLDGERLDVALEGGGVYVWRRLPTAAEAG